MKKYVPITQKPYCCVPACISMILSRRDIPTLSQEEIGYYLGLIVPIKDRKLFQKVRMGKKPRAGWGTQINKKEYSINNFFKKNKINLKEKHFFIEDTNKIQSFIRENLKDKDIMVCFNYGELYNTKDDFGHVSIVESIKKDSVILIDPGENLLKRRKVLITQLSRAIVYHKHKGGGFWVIS